MNVGFAMFALATTTPVLDRPRGPAPILNFLADAQLPAQLARWISSRGQRATHVFEAGLHGATDAAVWQHAANERAIKHVGLHYPAPALRPAWAN